MSREKIHPEVQKAMAAINLPEVQEMLRRLGEHGLGIVVPHMHSDDGEFLPLPEDKVSVEAGLHVSFQNEDDPGLQNAIPIAWRSLPDGTQTTAGKCVMVCKNFAFCGHHGVHRYRKTEKLRTLAQAARRFAAGQLSAVEYHRITRESMGRKEAVALPRK